jgi:hypothetical protein
VEARRPDDGPDLASAEIQLEPRRDRGACGLEAVRRVDVGVASVRARPLVERVEQAIPLQVRERELVAEAAREECPAVANGREASDDLRATGGEGIEIERGAFRRTDELRRRQPARADEIVDLVVALVPHA